MKNGQVDFDIKDEDAKATVGHKQIRCHPLFDIKQVDLTKRFQFVARGHGMDTPETFTYSYVASRGSVFISFIVADLNYLDALSVDIKNSYLNDPPREKALF